MSKMLSFAGRVGVFILGAALLIFTALRTLDLIGLTLPANQQVTAYFALAAFDGGLVLWSLFFAYGSHGTAQRVIGVAMIVVSLLGIITAFVADTFYQLTSKGLVTTADPAFVESAVWLLSIVIAVNIVAVVAVHLSEPATWRKIMAEIDAEAQAEDDAARPAPRVLTLPSAKVPLVEPPANGNGMHVLNSEVPGEVELLPKAPGQPAKKKG